MPSENKAAVRFSPSPTGFLHVGGLRTALFNYLFAKKYGGKFLLRIEDTDQARIVEGATEQIINTLKSYKIEPDNLENLVFQSARLEIYKKYSKQLIKNGHAYECFCAPERLEALRKEQIESRRAAKYDRLCLDLSDEEKQKRRGAGTIPVVRLKIPEGGTVFTDIIFGEITVENGILDDQILLKSDGFPTYHLANVIDDHDMGITHVIRGEEWIPSTPKHIILYQMLGWVAPNFAHLPLIVKSDRKKLSKRDKAADAQIYLKYFETEAVLNYIALLGWNPKTEQEIFTKDELTENFALEKVNRAAAVFDDKKLNWVNKQWIAKKGIGDSRFFAVVKSLMENTGSKATAKEFEKAVAQIVFQRVEDFWEIESLFKAEFMFFLAEPEYDPALLIWKDTPSEKIKNNLIKLRDFFPFHLERERRERPNLEEATKNFLKEQGIGTGEALWPLRVALTGLAASPGPFEIITAFAVLPEGKKIVVRRIKKAIENLGK